MLRFFKYLKSKPLGIIGLALVSSVILLAIIGPYIAPYNPDAMNLRNRFSPPIWMKGGDPKHVLGTDMHGKDILSRLICGARSSIAVGVLSSLIALTIGVSLGMLAGYGGGMLDIAIMRLVDIMLTLPAVMLAIIVVAILGPHSISIIIAMGLTMWSEYAKVIRSRILVLKEESFMLAAKAMGASHSRMILKHVFPNIIYIIIVISTLQIGLIILWSAGLSFIGLGGITVSWGWDIAAGRVYIGRAWWLSTFPGIAIFIAVLGFNLFGDFLRDYLDPTASKIV